MNTNHQIASSLQTSVFTNRKASIKLFDSIKINSATEETKMGGESVVIDQKPTG